MAVGFCVCLANVADDFLRRCDAACSTGYVMFERKKLEDLVVMEFKHRWGLEDEGRAACCAVDAMLRSTHNSEPCRTAVLPV